MTVSLEKYNIYRTPDGTLYDTSVKDSAKEVQPSNIKRDSKLYSYKEQMEELEAVAHVTLRLTEPQCTVDAGWEAEQPAEAAYRRVLRLLHDRCAAAGRLRAPAFVVCFHLLRHVLERANDDEELMLKGLKLIQMHAELRGDGDLSDPSLLPPGRLRLRLGGLRRGRSARAAGAARRPAQQTEVVSVCDAALPSLDVLADVLESLEGSELPHVLAERIVLIKFDDSDEMRPPNFVTRKRAAVLDWSAHRSRGYARDDEGNVKTSRVYSRVSDQYILRLVKAPKAFPHVHPLLEAIADRRMQVTITGPSEHSGVAHPLVHHGPWADESRESLAESRARHSPFK
ncbi:eIF-2-alpha kinase activator GCN1-like [Pollicipes pollicipes]|uniref:eIF-2-alpha kinase activator GCN1-like n=1 Tax=Pollicipes pollicipes TaxID=41117 RepID=UPI0018851C6E|nr:eIF-2-alpha kinase activator GCN1-like [Pollicipes pollicipes]